MCCCEFGRGVGRALVVCGGRWVVVVVRLVRLRRGFAPPATADVAADLRLKLRRNEMKDT